MCNGWLFYPFHLEIHVFVVCVGYLDSEQLNCMCVLPVIGECMVWFGLFFSCIFHFRKCHMSQHNIR